MTPRPSTIAWPTKPFGMAMPAIAALAAMALALSGCGDRKKEKAASQTAARVNKEEITVHQINLYMQQQRGLKPEQIDAASKQILQKLIDQELAVQRTQELNIDQDPRVVLQLDAAKREVLARAYAEMIGESAAKPTAEEIKKYYDSKPALFKDRRIYSFQELAIEAKPEQVAALRDQLQRSKTASDFVQSLKATGLRFNGDHGVRAAEQLPENVLDGLAKMKDGEMLLLPSPAGAVVLLLGTPECAA